MHKPSWKENGNQVALLSPSHPAVEGQIPAPAPPIL